MLLDPAAEREDAEPLGGVVTGGEVVDPVLGGLVQHPLGRLAGDVGVEAGCDRLVVVPLRGAGHDSDRRHQASVALEDLRIASAGLGDRVEQLVRRDRLREHAADAHRPAVIVAEGLQLDQPEPVGELGRVAEIGVTIERQVVGDQRQPVLDQQPHPLAERARDPRRLGTVPEDPVVHEDRVGVPIDGPGEQGTRCRHRRHDSLNIRLALDLEPVGTVVVHLVRVEELVELGDQLHQVHIAMVAHEGSGCRVGERSIRGGTIGHEMAARRLLLLAAVGLAALSLAACGREAAQPQPAEARLEVGLLVSAPASSRWEQQADRGLDRIAAELGATVRRATVTDAVVTRDLVVQASGRPADLVFCVGPDFANSVFTEAPSFPSTRFVLVPGRGHGANVAGIELLPAGAGYVAGVVAANLRPSAAVGVVRGAGEAWLEELERGFLAGFHSARRGAKVVVVDSADGPWRLAGDGVEIALYATDQPEDEVLAAAHDAGVLLVAADSALLIADPDVVAAAVQVDLAEAMVRLAREVRAGTFVGSQYAFDLGSGVLDVRLNPTLPGNQLPALREALELARSEVTAGIVEMEGLGM